MLEVTNLVCNIFLVKVIYLYLLVAVAGLEELQKVLKKLVAELVDKLLGVLAHDEHLTHVALRLRVHLEAVGIAALLLADLAVPSQPLQALGLELVAQVLGRADLCFRHFWRR